MMEKSTSTLYRVVSEGPGGTPVDHLRFAMAEEALNDPEWRSLYDQVLGSVFGFPENVPALMEATTELPAVRDPESTLLGQWLGSVNHCAAPLRMRAMELGLEPAQGVRDVDLVASVIAAEIWCTALAVTDLSRAASLGVDSVSSLAAILARASGHGVDHPLPSQEANPKFHLSRIDPVVGMLLKWAETVVGYSGAHYALQLAVQDLAYRAEGQSMPFEAALRTRDMFLRR